MSFKVSLMDAAGKTKEQLGKTSIHYRKNSVFNSLFSCKDIASADLQDLAVNMSLYSQDHSGQNHFVGGVTMNFDDVTFEPSTPVYFWRPVQRKVREREFRDGYTSMDIFFLY